MVEDAIVARLKTVAALGSRIYPVVGDKGCAIPFAAYQQTGEEQKQALSSGVGLFEADYTVNILAKTYGELKSIKAAAQAAIEAMQGSAVGGITFKKVSIKRDSKEFWDQNTDLLGKQLNFTLTYREV